MSKLFGTDGIRGIFGEALTEELAFSVGKALCAVLNEDGIPSPSVFIGRDTRSSSPILAKAVAEGLNAAGAYTVDLGVVSTPATAYLCKEHASDAAVMISASHNPYEYNGIKVFSKSGYKLSDTLEERIEALLNAPENRLQAFSGMKTEKNFPCAEEMKKEYIALLKSTLPEPSTRLRVAFDCANGSASATAPTLFTSLSIDAHFLSCAPDGRNINEDCGSTHIETLAEYVKANSLDCGFAFDGDADRCLCVDENGETVNGDEILAMCSLDMKSEGRLKNNTVVGTVMTNFGFNSFAREHGIELICTKVGDRYVLEEMLRGGFSLGGEQSGHIIFGDYATTGDGQLTALQVLRLMEKTGKPLSELKRVMTPAPQVQINLPATEAQKRRFYTESRITGAIEEAKALLGEHGRIVVRPSGTEPLIRIMTEGSDESLIKKAALSAAKIIKESI